jgi:hypothetical protein
MRRSATIAVCVEFLHFRCSCSSAFRWCRRYLHFLRPQTQICLPAAAAMEPIIARWECNDRTPPHMGSLSLPSPQSAPFTPGQRPGSNTMKHGFTRLQVCFRSRSVTRSSKRLHTLTPRLFSIQHGKSAVLQHRPPSL